LTNDDDEVHRVTEIERITNGKTRYLDMDEAFCARMHAARIGSNREVSSSASEWPPLKNSGNSRAIPANVHSHHFNIRATQFGPVFRF